MAGVCEASSPTRHHISTRQTCCSSKAWPTRPPKPTLCPLPPTTAATDPSLRQLLSQLWAHLGRRRRLQLAVLANPEGLWNQPLLLPITNAFALAAAIGSDLSCELYRRTLYQPFDEYLAHNSSELIASIRTDVN